MIERLKWLIDSLSSKEKKQFRYFISAGNDESESRMFVRLFEELSSKRTGRESIEAKLRLDWTKKELNNYCKYLTDKIFECLATNDNSSPLGIMMIEKAIDKGFVKLGITYLKKEFKWRFETQDMNSLPRLVKIARFLHRFREKGDQLGGILQHEENILRQSSLLHRADFLSAEFRNQVLNGIGDGKNDHSIYAEEVLGMYSEDLFPFVRAGILKMLVRWARLGRQFEDAYFYQNRLVEVMNANNERFKPEERLAEQSLLVSFLMHHERYDEAGKVLLDMGRGRTDSERCKEQFEREWVRQTLMSRFVKSVSVQFTSYAPLIKAWSVLESGDSLQAKRFLEGFRPINIYQELVHEVLSEIVSSEDAELPLRKMAKWSERIGIMENDPSLIDHIGFFNIRIWLTSKIDQEPITTLILKNEGKGLFIHKMVS